MHATASSCHFPSEDVLNALSKLPDWAERSNARRIGWHDENDLFEACDRLPGAAYEQVLGSKMIFFDPAGILYPRRPRGQQQCPSCNDDLISIYDVYESGTGTYYCAACALDRGQNSRFGFIMGPHC